MDLTDSRFVRDLQAALRCGMVAALHQQQTLMRIGATGVERTLYGTLRETAVQYLNTLGYAYLTADKTLFVIGEVGVPGTNKRADGLICDPHNGCPVFAIEIGMAGSEKFRQDFDKALTEWTRTGLSGVFVLLFDTEQDDLSVYELDGAVLQTPRKDNFSIFPLIAATKPSLETALLSVTCSQFWDRQNQRLRALTISDRDRGEINLWATGLIQRLADKCMMPFVNEIRCGGKGSFDYVFQRLKPQIFILEGEESPLAAVGPLVQQEFSQYRNREHPLIVFIAAWIERKKWESDPLTESLLPVRIIGEEHHSGGWDYWKTPLKFGKDIKPGNKSFLNLSGLNNTECSIQGFIKVAPKERPGVHVELEVTTAEGTFPLIVTDTTERVVWIGTGTGGWGADWYNKYPDEYLKVWEELLTKFQIVRSSVRD